MNRKKKKKINQIQDGVSRWDKSGLTSWLLGNYSAHWRLVKLSMYKQNWHKSTVDIACPWHNGLVIRLFLEVLSFTHHPFLPLLIQHIPFFSCLYVLSHTWQVSLSQLQDLYIMSCENITTIEHSLLIIQFKMWHF